MVESDITLRSHLQYRRPLVSLQDQGNDRLMAQLGSANVSLVSTGRTSAPTGDSDFSAVRGISHLLDLGISDGQTGLGRDLLQFGRSDQALEAWVDFHPRVLVDLISKTLSPQLGGNSADAPDRCCTAHHLARRTASLLVVIPGTSDTGSRLGRLVWLSSHHGDEFYHRETMSS